MIRFSILFLSLYLYTSPMTGQAGQLDSSFNAGGVVIYDGGANRSELCYSSALQPDGKILLCGQTKAGSSVDFLVLRYLTDGTLDSTFGENGIVLADFKGQDETAYAMFIQRNGRIVLSGSTSPTPGQLDVAVHRMLPDGTPDPSFGEDGWVVTDLGSDFEIGLAIAIQADTKILVAGRVADGFEANFAMMRYFPDGQLDSLFGENGIVNTNFREEDSANALRIQPDGKIVLAGFASVAASGDFALARYLPDGTLDKLFGDGGKVMTDLEGNGRSDFITGLSLLPDGRMVAVGTANAIHLPSSSATGIAMYLPNGDLDTSFGQDGIQIYELGTRSNWADVAPVPDGRLLVCGKSNMVQDENRWILARLTSQGAIDQTFGQQGYVTLQMNGSIASAGKVWLQPDSRILLTGLAGTSPDFDFAAARYLSELILPSLTTAVTCRGGSDGSLSISVQGGVPPFTYSLDGGPFGDNNFFTGLTGGDHYVSVRDANGMIAVSGYITVPEPELPLYDVIVIGSSLTVQVTSGGTEPLQYSIDGGITFQADPHFPDLTDGTYSVVVMDALGCIVIEDEVTIMATGLSATAQGQEARIFPNPSQGSFRIQFDDPVSSEINISLYTMTGQVIRSLTFSASGNTYIDISARDIEAGIYWLVLRNTQSLYYGKVMIQP